MKVRIYQINHDRDRQLLRWMGSWLYEQENNTLSLQRLDRSLYDEVFDGEIDARDLDGLYDRLNDTDQRRPEGYRGTSLSTSDVVEILERGDPLLCEAPGLWFVDSFGFKPCAWDGEADA